MLPARTEVNIQYANVDTKQKRNGACSITWMLLLNLPTTIPQIQHQISKKSHMRMLNIDY